MQTLNNFILYFFLPVPGRTFQYYTFVSVLIAVLIILGIIFKLYIKKNRDDKAFRKLFKKFPKKLWIMAILLGIYLAMRYNYVPILSMRLFFYIILGLTGYLFYQVINAYLKKYPELKKALSHKNSGSTSTVIKHKKKKKAKKGRR